MTSRGRPKDSFGDPVVRLRSWAWQWRLCSDTGLEAHADLARKFDLQCPSLFRKVRDDGADPHRLQVADSCLAKVVARLPEGLGAYQDCTHELWEALARRKVERRPHCDQLSSAEFLSKLQPFGIVRVSQLDSIFAMMLGLPRQFPGSELPAATELHLEPAEFATLDGLHVLLQLYRNATHAGALKFAGVFGEALEEAVSLYANSRWSDRTEIMDTWHWILHSRMLSWRPYLKPTTVQLEHGRQEWIQLNDGSVEVDGAAEAPKLQLRDRREIFVHACAAMFVQEAAEWHYVHATDALRWLAENRKPITEKVTWALNNFRSTDDAKLMRPEPLVMPPHLFSMRTRPRGEANPTTGFSLGKVFELIPVVEAK